MPPLPRKLLPLALALLASPGTAAPPPPADSLGQAWTDATLYLFKQSYLEFKQAEGREARLGRAALLLLQQPKTEANLAQAERELTALAELDPPDEHGAAALYLLGRLAQLHRARPDDALAARHYRRLIAARPEHLLADQARIKLALIALHAPGLAPDQLPPLFDTLGAEADALARPASRRDYHLVLATAAQHHRLGDERLLRHYLAADRAGITSPTPRSNVTVAVGELASRLGQNELARHYFERFLAEFTRDYRRTLVRDKLAALPAPGPTPTP